MPDENNGVPDKERTEVTTWLREYQASAFVDAFYKQGYLKVSEVDDAAIDKLVTRWVLQSD